MNYVEGKFVHNNPFWLGIPSWRLFLFRVSVIRPITLSLISSQRQSIHSLYIIGRFLYFISIIIIFSLIFFYVFTVQHAVSTTFEKPITIQRRDSYKGN